MKSLIATMTQVGNTVASMDWSAREKNELREDKVDAGADAFRGEEWSSLAS